VFSCPLCRKPLSQQRETVGVIWFCSGCQGRVVGVAVMRQILEKIIVDQLWQQARSVTATSDLCCPGCLSPMSLTPYQTKGKSLSIHVCLMCQFFWLKADAWEGIRNVQNTLGTNVGNAIPSSAQEMLLKLQLEQMRERADATYGPDAPPGSWKIIPALFGLPVHYGEGQEMELGVYCLSLIMISVFLVTGGAAVQSFGFIPAQPFRMGGLTVLSAFFLHGGLLHLIGNLYFFLMFGKKVEIFLGTSKMLILVFGTAIAASLAHWMADPASPVPCIGASGGISGVMMFYALKFSGDRLGFYWFGRGWVRVPAILFMVFWIIFQLRDSMLQVAGLTNVSAIGHLGGAIAGLLFWVFWRRGSKVQTFGTQSSG